MNNQTQGAQTTDSSWNPALNYDDSEQLGNAGARWPGQGQISDPLRIEAISDFQQLDGWWHKIIIRDMLNYSPNSLPRMLLM